MKQGYSMKQAHRLAKGGKKPKNKTNKKRTTRTSRNRSSGSNRRRSFTVPIALVGGASAGFLIKPANTWYSPAEAIMKGEYKIAMNNYLTNMVGYRPDTGKFFDTEIGMKGTIALFMGALIHKGASMLGINRALGRAGVPILRI